jgi:hypothetical protein
VPSIEISGDAGGGRAQAPAVSSGETGADLLTYSGRVPHGTILRGVYKGYEYKAEVRDGRVAFQGRLYRSLSKAAMAAITSSGNPRLSENGWKFWMARNDDGDWVPLIELRGKWSRSGSI